MPFEIQMVYFFFVPRLNRIEWIPFEERKGSFLVFPSHDALWRFSWSEWERGSLSHGNRALCCKSNCNLAEWTSDHLTYRCENNKLKHRTMGRNDSIKIYFSENRMKREKERERKKIYTRTQNFSALVISIQFKNSFGNIHNISSWCANFWLMSTNLSTCPSILCKATQHTYTQTVIAL